MLDVHLHIGGLMLFSQLANQLSGIRKFRRANPNLFVASDTIFDDTVAPLLEADAAVDSPGFRLTANAAVRHLTGGSDTGRLVLSRPTLLGRAGETFGAGGLYPEAVQHIRLIRDIFDTEALHFHMVISPVTAFLRRIRPLAPKVAQSFAAQSPNHLPSWLDVVKRVATAAAPDPVFVYDAEAPRRAFAPLLSGLTGVSPDQLAKIVEPQHLRQILDRILWEEAFDNQIKISGKVQELAEDCYDAELDAIGSIDNVILKSAAPTADPLFAGLNLQR